MGELRSSKAHGLFKRLFLGNLTTLLLFLLLLLLSSGIYRVGCYSWFNVFTRLISPWLLLFLMRCDARIILYMISYYRCNRLQGVVCYTIPCSLLRRGGVAKRYKFENHSRPEKEASSLSFLFGYNVKCCYAQSRSCHGTFKPCKTKGHLPLIPRPERKVSDMGR